jgi:hypothetical protein
MRVAAAAKKYFFTEYFPTSGFGFSRLPDNRLPVAPRFYLYL